MGEQNGVDLSFVALGTLLLVVSASILVVTGHLTSPIPVLVLAATPPGIVAAMWFRTDGGRIA